jgi:6-pyruvoyl-tetrahydropterin synthase
MKTPESNPQKSYRKILLVAMILLLTAVPDFVSGQKNAQPQPGRLRIKVTPGFSLRLSQARMTTARVGRDRIMISGIKPLDAVHKVFKVRDLKRVFRDAGIYEARHRKYGLDRWYEIDMDTTGSVADAIAAFGSIEGVEKVEPVYKKAINGSDRRDFGPVYVNTPAADSSIDGPNDPLFAQQWHYHNTGQSGGTPGADIDLLKGWKLETGKRQVVVAVMDGGIQTDHPDLAANMWINTGEIPGNNTDDDGNGYTDDIYGYGFGDDTGTIAANAHGTHVAGTIAAVTNNGIGVSGVAGGSGNGDGVRLMSCAVFGATAQGHFPEAYVYAADMGAVISQNSWGYSYGYETVVLEAIDYFIAEAGKDPAGNQVGLMNGGVVIFAAGNEDYDYEAYPGYYEPVIAVAATTHEDKKARYSNYGGWVDIAAPGGETDLVQRQGVFSTLSPNAYGFFQGTSMACPHVSGVAALLVSKFGAPGYTPQALRERLLTTTDDINLLLQHPFYRKKLGSGRLNTSNALYVRDLTAPQMIQDLSITDVTHTSLTVSWTSPIDPGDFPAAAYDLRYSTTPITADNFALADSASGVPASQSQGAQESFTITSLNANTPYYVAIKARDLSGNISALSNVLQLRTYSPPQLTVSPLTLSATLVTAETTTRLITFFNHGEAALNFRFASSVPASFATPEISEGKILSGDSLSVVITLRAHSLLSGTYHQNLALLTDDPLHATFSIPVELTVTNNGLPVLALEPSTVDFDTVTLGTVSRKKILIRNEGSVALSVDSVYCNAAFFTTEFAPIVLQPFDTISLPVHFAPVAAGHFTGMITVISNDPASPEKSVALSGEGYDPFGGVVVRPAAFQETLRHPAGSSKTLVIRNTSASPVSISLQTMNGFYNTAPPNLTSNKINAVKEKSATTHTVKQTPARAAEKPDPYSARYFPADEESLEDKASVSTVATPQSPSFQFGTDFEGYHVGAIPGQATWQGEQLWTVDLSNPFSGEKHLRYAPGQRYAYVFSPRVSIGTEEKSTITLQLNRGASTRGYWQIIPGSPSAGYVATRIIIDHSGTLQVLIDDGNGSVLLETIPTVLPEGYFEMSFEVIRATKVFSLYIEGEKIYTALGFTGNIEQTAFLGDSDGTFDIDNFRIIDGSQEGIPYVTINPSNAAIPAGDSISVAVTFATEHLAFNDYTSSIKVRPEGWKAITVPVSLSVTGDPQLTVNNNVPVFLPVGKDTSTQIMLRNTGGALIQYTVSIVYAGTDTTWLSAEKLSGAVAPNQLSYLTLHFDAASLAPAQYTASLVINSNAPALTIPIVLNVTAPGHIVVNPVIFDIDGEQDFDHLTLDIHNTGESRLHFTLESYTKFHQFYSPGLTPLNADPVQPGPDAIAAVPNTATRSPWGTAYEYRLEDYMPNGNINGADHWGADEHWEGIRPIEYVYYIRGKSDGSRQSSTVFSPLIPQGSENISTARMRINLVYSSGTTWQIVAQTSAHVVTRLQINPDQTLQVLVRDEQGHASFQHIRETFPEGYFDVKIEVDRLTSVFSIFFNGGRVFTGQGFADHVEQLGILSMMEEAGSTIFFDEFGLYDCVSALQVTDEYEYEQFRTNKVSGFVDPDQTSYQELLFTSLNLLPGTYRDSLKITTDDPTQPVLHIPYTVTITRPYVPPGDYKSTPGLQIPYDSLTATAVAGDTVTVNIPIHNPSDIPLSVYFPAGTEYPYLAKGFAHGSRNFEWIDISATGTKLDLGDDDSETIQLAFPVNLGSPHDSDHITISSNGYLRVGDVDASSPLNMQLNSYYYSVENIIALYWDDLSPDEYSAIYYQADTEKLIVQYTNLPFYGTNIRNTFQAIITKDGSIKYQYLEMHDQQGASIGLAGSPYMYPIGIATNEPYVTDSLAVVILKFASPVQDTATGDYRFVLTPWIRYPDGESLTVAPHSTANLPVLLSSFTPGIHLGNIVLGSFFQGSIWDDPSYYPLYDGNAFVMPITFTVTGNPAPVIHPVEALILAETTSQQITFSATDANDSLITVFLENAPAFITLHHTSPASSTYTFAPATTDIGEYDFSVVAKDLGGNTSTLAVHLSVIPYRVTGFSIVNSSTGEVVSDFIDQATINQADPDFSVYTIRANTTPEAVGSLKFKIDGSQSNIDNSNPYLLKNRAVVELPTGEHKILAEPFTEKNGHGKRGRGLEAAVTIINATHVVVDFSLVNIVTGEVLLNFDKALTLDRSRTDFADLNIRANTLPATVGSVKFRVNGPQRNIDNTNPYMLKPGTLVSFAGGENVLRAEPFTEKNGHGQRGQSKDATITVLEAGARIVDFSLVNTVTGEVLLNFNNTLTLNRYRPDLADLTIMANTLPATVGCVKFKVNGTQRNIDNTNPYTLKKQLLSALAGENILLAEPFTEANGHGQRGEGKEVIVILQDLPMTVDFSLVNVVTGQVLENFDAHLTLDRSHPDFASLNIRANTLPATVGSVKFKINGLQRNLDNSTPYLLSSQVLQTLPVGDTRLYAEPLTEANGHGLHGQPLEAIITLVNGSSASAKAADRSQHEVYIEKTTVDVYPLPVKDVLKFNVRGQDAPAYQLTLINTLGQTVFKGQVAAGALENFEFSTNEIGLGSGVYYLHLLDGKGARVVKKIVKN